MLVSLKSLVVPEMFNRLPFPGHHSSTPSPLYKLTVCDVLVGSINRDPSRTTVSSGLISNGDLYWRSDPMSTMHSI
jgi:hypothetical protein